MFSFLEYVESIEKKNTQKTVRSAIASFLEYIQSDEKILSSRTPGERVQRDEATFHALDTFSVQYLSTTDDPFSDLYRWITYMSKRGYAPLTVRPWKSIIYTWLIMNDFEISAKKDANLKRKLPKNRALTEDRAITADEAATLVEHASHPLRAIIYCLISSGMRIGEVLSLTYDDINFETSPVEVFISEENAKNDTARYTFLSCEAVKSLREWGKVREKRLKQAANRGKGIGQVKSLTDPRIFPYSQVTMGESFRSVLLAAGLHQLDPKTNREVVTFHSLRKFFSSQLRLGMSEDMVELLVGHDGYLSKSYRRYTKQQVREAYTRAEYTISLSNPVNSLEIQETRDRLNLMTSKYVTLQDKYDSKIEDLTIRIERMQSQFVDADTLAEKYEEIKKRGV